jgi:hypothetical protein
MKPELDPKLLRSMAPFLLNALLAQKNWQDLQTRYYQILVDGDSTDPEWSANVDSAFSECIESQTEAGRLMDSTLRAILGPNYNKLTE